MDDGLKNGKIINQYTGRKIKVGGATYKKLWRDLCPYSQTERRQVAQTCTAQKCFLRPETLSYPVCPKMSYANKNVDEKCQPHCLGISAAYKRSRQYKAQNIADKAIQLKKEYKC